MQGNLNDYILEQCIRRVSEVLNFFMIIIFLSRLQIPNLGIDEKYQKIFQNYGHDIETICKIYTRYKKDPPLARNLPPIAGKILWARHLFHRIKGPMETFQRHPAVLRTPDGKSIIRNYNKVAKVLMKFEVIYYREWLQQVSQPVLIRIVLKEKNFKNGGISG